MGHRTSLVKLARARNAHTRIKVLRDIATTATPELRVALAKNTNVPVDLLAVFARDRRETIRSAVALSKNASSELLEMLATDERSAARRAVAKNPNTPPTTLMRLAADLDREVQIALIHNPKLPVALYKTLVETLDAAGRKRIAKTMPCYPEILKILAIDSNPKVARMVAWNPNLDDDMLVWLAGINDVILQTGVALHKRGLTDRAFGILLETGNNEILSALASNTKLREPMLLQLFERCYSLPAGQVGDGKPSVAQNLCYNKSIPVELQLRLANDFPELRRAFGYNVNASPDILQMLAMDDDFLARCLAARHPSTPPESLEILTRDQEWLVRKHALWNAGTPETARTDVIKAADPEWQIRNSTASERQTSSDVLASLATDESREVRVSVAGNPSTPPSVLSSFARSSDQWMRSRTSHNPSTPPEGLRNLWISGDESFARALAWNPGTPADVLNALSRHANAEVRRGVVYNNATPVETLKAMLGSGERYFRRLILVTIEKRES
jgi:hypothetical protein